MASFWNTGISSSYHLQEDTKTQQRTQEKSVERTKQIVFLLRRGMSQHRNVDRSRHLWTTVYCTDVQIEIWTGGSRNEARLIVGMVADEKNLGVSTLAVNSLLTQNATDAELWRPDTMGIRDWAETWSRQETEGAALHHFEENVITGEDGHCEVCLPWLKVHEALQENIDTVRKWCLHNN